MNQSDWFHRLILSFLWLLKDNLGNLKKGRILCVYVCVKNIHNIDAYPMFIIFIGYLCRKFEIFIIWKTSKLCNVLSLLFYYLSNIVVFLWIYTIYFQFIDNLFYICIWGKICENISLVFMFWEIHSCKTVSR